MRRTPLRPKPPADHSGEPGFKAWKAPTIGNCQACGRRGLLLRHHAVLEQHVRAEGGDPWNLDNAVALGYYACACHSLHHQAVRRLPASCLSPANLAFMVELLGEDRAAEYIVRYYRVG